MEVSELDPNEAVIKKWGGGREKTKTMGKKHLGKNS